MPSPVAVVRLMQLANRTRPTADEGQDLLEYGLLAALIAIVALGAVSVVGQTVHSVFWKTIGASV